MFKELQMDRKEYAVSNFNNGLNCSQSVLSAYTKDFGLDENTAAKIACGFGGGMGRMQETCGAVSGAIMVLGLKFGKTKNDDDSLRIKTYELVRKFADEFKKLNKTARCRDLLDCDLNTDEGHNFFKENNLRVTVCEKCIKGAVNILDKILKDNA
jgi:C_GCAxxG_C_C family probable redox protein